MQRKLTFEQACNMYVYRFTMDHVPEWTQRPMPDGLYCAPSFRTDREWYDNTRFPGEQGWIGLLNECHTTGQTWPLGQWLDAPYSRKR